MLTYVLLRSLYRPSDTHGFRRIFRATSSLAKDPVQLSGTVRKRFASTSPSSWTDFPSAIASQSLTLLSRNYLRLRCLFIRSLPSTWTLVGRSIVGASLSRNNYVRLVHATRKKQFYLLDQFHCLCVVANLFISLNTLPSTLPPALEFFSIEYNYVTQTYLDFLHLMSMRP